MKTKITLRLLIVLNAWACGCAAAPSVKRVSSAQDLKAQIDAGQVHVVHALSAEHYVKGHIPGAANIDYEKMKPDMLPADKNAPLVFYCSGPMCPVSKMAANKAAQWGYTNVSVYEGGMKDWQSSGMPVSTGDK
jgi:rhodanese-related sulfurtransferase